MFVVILYGPGRSAKFMEFLAASHAEKAETLAESKKYLSRKAASQGRASIEATEELRALAIRSPKGQPKNMAEAIAQIVTYEDEPDVVKAGLKVIQKGLKGDKVHKDELRINHGLGVLVGAMEAHPDDNGVQAAGAAAIWSACSRNDENRCLIAEYDGAATLVGAMNRAQESRRVISECMGALLNLSMYVDGNRYYILDAGGIPATLAAIRIHSEDTLTMRFAVGLLFTLAHNVDCRAVIAKEGGLQQVAKLLSNKVHWGDKEFVEYGIGFFKNAVNTDEVHADIVRAGVPALVRELADLWGLRSAKVAARAEYVIGRLEMTGALSPQ